MSHIDEDAFRNTSVLEKLYISNNSLASVPPIQDLADTLITLQISGNKIQIIPDLYFASCAMLQYLDISGNRLTTINQKSFSGLASIRELHLRGNMIANIVDPFIWNLRNLTYIYLDDNKLTRLPTLARNGSSAQLNCLSVASNSIGNITESQLHDILGVETLNIGYTLITDLEFISVLHDLRHLHLSNILTPITASFPDNIPSLITLALADNGLVTFPLLSASQVSLDKLDLSRNEIRCVDVQPLANMTNLRFLHLQYNNIENFFNIGCKDENNVINAWHDLQFPFLETLHVDNNQIAELKRDVLVKMPGLTVLVASFNKIDSMPFLSAVGASLRYAYLDHNNISHIEEQHIAGLRRLYSLKLSYNDIADLNLHLLAHLQGLQVFDLRHNKLLTPPRPADFNHRTSMNIILTKNPYVCDSRMCLIENYALFMDKLLCVTPLKLAGRSIQSVMESMYCGKYRHQQNLSNIIKNYLQTSFHDIWLKHLGLSSHYSRKTICSQ